MVRATCHASAACRSSTPVATESPFRTAPTRHPTTCPTARGYRLSASRAPLAGDSPPSYGRPAGHNVRAWPRVASDSQFLACRGSVPPNSPGASVRTSLRAGRSDMNVIQGSWLQGVARHGAANSAKSNKNPHFCECGMHSNLAARIPSHACVNAFPVETTPVRLLPRYMSTQTCEREHSLSCGWPASARAQC